MAHETNSKDNLFLVSYNSTCQLFTSDEMNKLEKPFIKSDLQGKINSIKQVSPINEQRSELDSLTFELKMNSQILESLVQKLYKLEDNSKEYIDALENISFFVHHNIIDLTKEKIDVLNSVLEYETIK